MQILLKHALDQAAVWHRDQRRKYPNADVPYVSHLAGVAGILLRHGFSEEVAAAGALHDSMEDCGVTFERLREAFGETVATLVRHVSEEDKGLSWEERKAAYLAHFKVKPWEAQAITLADKIDNFTSIAVCKKYHGEPWAMFKRGRDAQLERFTAMENAITKAHPLADEYRAALAELRAL